MQAVRTSATSSLRTVSFLPRESLYSIFRENSPGRWVIVQNSCAPAPKRLKYNIFCPTTHVQVAPIFELLIDLFDSRMKCGQHGSLTKSGCKRWSWDPTLLKFSSVKCKRIHFSREIWSCSGDFYFFYTHSPPAAVQGHDRGMTETISKPGKKISLRNTYLPLKWPFGATNNVQVLQEMLGRLSSSETDYK